MQKKIVFYQPNTVVKIQQTTKSNKREKYNVRMKAPRQRIYDVPIYLYVPCMLYAMHSTLRIYKPIEE